ncbi:hypothetical protein [Granulicella mallensis]|uniref:Uncharacterized protein n=1 Tax=Granulicella mallensis TaxID=940614 RepID=A0A7W8EC39_9BACT|nr:hypothetical protein [Granulicella mallensis]MBB5066229.1 hypothetical protein [Granulicella mallensis]
MPNTSRGEIAFTVVTSHPDSPALIWAGFWRHDVVVKHLHEVIYGGPSRIDSDYTRAKPA